jgi:hypothetical protein
MLIGQTMQRHYLGRDWRMPNTTSMLRPDKDYCNIVRWCTDYPGPACIYAIHHIIQCGMIYDKLPGEWYGPSTASLVLRDLTRLHRRKYHGPVEAHVTTGDTIYITEVEKTFTAVKCDEIDPFWDDDDDEGSKTNRRRRSKGKGRSRKDKTVLSSTSQDSFQESPQKPIRGSSSRRAESNQRVTPVRSEESVSSSLESHCRDLEDDANSFTHSVSSDSHNRSPCHSVSSASVDGDHAADDNSTIDVCTDQSLESNPFVLRSHSGDVTSKTAVDNLEPKSIFRLSSEGAVTFAGLDLELPSNDVKQENNSFLDSSTQGGAAKEDHHDPLLNPPPVVKEAEWPASLLLLLPLRLGLDKFNPMYIPALKEFLRHRNSVGILGGQVNRAIYFVGYRGNTLLGMDPHTVYKTPPLTAPFPSSEHLEQIHRNDLHELSFDLLDPSLALAFYFHDRYEFQAFCDETKFHNEQGLKTGRISLYNVQYAPAAMQFNMDLSGLCDSESDGE